MGGAGKGGISRPTHFFKGKALGTRLGYLQYIQMLLLVKQLRFSKDFSQIVNEMLLDNDFFLLSYDGY